MHRIFSYGTLQEEKVQLSTFGRLLNGQKDELPAFQRSLVKIEHPAAVAEFGKTHYDNVKWTGQNKDRVSGALFDITDAEISAADEYERDADYSRMPVTLASGARAWVYLRLDANEYASEPVQITTSRLILRKPRRENAPAMFAAYAQDPEVTRYLLWTPHRDVSASYAFLDRSIAGWESKTEYVWLIFQKRSEQLIGSFAARPETDGFSFGYLLARPHWGRGYMPEAISAVVTWAFTDPSVRRVSAACDVENSASARALEKAGFTRDAILPAFSVPPNVSANPRDCYRYVKTRLDPP
jgi:RimJ/RimL family protein N-acetyltransferase